VSFSERVDALVDALAEVRLPGLFNPWCDSCEYDLTVDAPDKRQQRLRAHLLLTQPMLILTAEACGWAGARYSGVAMTSERLLYQGAVPRLEHVAQQRISKRALPFSEQTSTIVWKALYEHGVAAKTLLWNTVPWHPHNGQPHSNRTPTQQEQNLGHEFLAEFIHIFAGVPIIAVGRIAHQHLTTLGLNAVGVTHPANGGANAFREGLRQFLIHLKQTGES